MLDPRPTDPIPPAKLLAVVGICLGLMFVLMLCSCSTEPDGNIQLCGKKANIPVIPPVSDQREAMDKGWGQAVETCPAAAGDVFRPAIRFLPGDFWVENGRDVPGGAGHGICASGCCYTAAGEIWISLAYPEDTLDLIVWESRNMAWTRNGCDAQAYRRMPKSIN